MAKDKGTHDWGGESGTPGGTTGSNEHVRARYARWEDVPDRVRAEVDRRLATYHPAPLNPDGSIAWDRFTATDGRGRLRLNHLEIDDAALIPLVREKLTYLTGLWDLRLGGNQIAGAGLVEIAPCFQHLTSLHTLWLNDNQIGAAGVVGLVPCLQHLTGLQTLGLNRNQIGDEGLAQLGPFLSHLTALQDLQLGRNMISEIGLAKLAPCLRHLTGLRTLWLYGNVISDVGAIVRLIEAIGPGGIPGGSLIAISVRENPLEFKAAAGKVRRVPPEALTVENPDELLAQLKRYAPPANDVGQFKPLNCLRVTVLGRQGVGKSHLALRLANGGDLQTDDEGNTVVPAKTADWELHRLPKEEVVLMSASGTRFRPVTVELRLLDFGGDPELHSAHRLLLRDKRNFYVVVCDASNGRDASLLDYWLRIVRAYGSPTVDAGSAESGSSRAADRGASAVVVLSWCDQSVHGDFAGLSGAGLSGQHRVNVHLVPGYWEPTAKTLGTPPAGRTFAEAIRSLREAIRACVAEQAHELEIHYPAAFPEVIDLFDPARQQGLKSKTPLCDGPIPLAEVESMFARATGNLLDGRTGALLLCNLGLAVCPKLDADHARQHWVGQHLPAAAADTVELTDELVFGSQWLKRLIYKVVRRTDSPLSDDRGVVHHGDLMQTLEKEIGGGVAAAGVAKRVRALLLANRMLFARDKLHGTYLVPERLPEADAEAVRTQAELFANASRWTLRPRLLLASHLSQFLAEEYQNLAAGDAIHSSMFRDMGKLRWRMDPAVEALLTANLNRGVIDIAIRGADGVEAADRFARSIADSWARVLVETELVVTPAGSRRRDERRKPPREDSAPAAKRETSGEGETSVPDLQQSRDGPPMAKDLGALQPSPTGRAPPNKVLRGLEITRAIIDLIDADPALSGPAQTIREKLNACDEWTLVRDYCKAVRLVIERHESFALMAKLAGKHTEVDAVAFRECLKDAELLRRLRVMLIGREGAWRRRASGKPSAKEHCAVCGFCGAVAWRAEVAGPTKTCRACKEPFPADIELKNPPRDLYYCQHPDHSDICYAVDYAHAGDPRLDKRSHGGCIRCKKALKRVPE